MTLLTEKQAAKLLNVPVRTVIRLRKTDDLPFCNIGNQVRYFAQELIAWAKKQHQRVDRGPKPKKITPLKKRG